jgi:hypothetical protein
VIWVLIIGVIVAGAYVATRKKKPPEPSPTYHLPPKKAQASSSLTYSTTDTSGRFTDPVRVRDEAVRRMKAAGLLQMIEYAPAGTETPAGPHALVGDICVTIVDTERSNRERSFILTDIPRGDEVKYLIAQDAGPGIARAHNFYTIGSTEEEWSYGGDVPSSVDTRTTHVNMITKSSYRISAFSIDIADCLGLRDIPVYAVSTGRQIFRTTQALKRQSDVWTDVFKPAVTGVATTAASVVQGFAAGGPAGAIGGFVSATMSIAADPYGRRRSLFSALNRFVEAWSASGFNDTFTGITSFTLGWARRLGSVYASLASLVAAAQSLMSAWDGAVKCFGAAMWDQEMKLRMLRNGLATNRKPYRLKKVIFYT